MKNVKCNGCGQEIRAIDSVQDLDGKFYCENFDCDNEMEEI